jgi:predicted RecB family nuclease
MRNMNGSIVFAAHDLDRFLACSHGTFLDIHNLQEPLPRSKEDEQLRLVREKGFEHEKTWLDSLKRQGISIAEIPEKASLHERADATLDAMNSGADIIYQAALMSDNWHGYADFLRRTETAGVNRALSATHSHCRMPPRLVLRVEVPPGSPSKSAR